MYTSNVNNGNKFLWEWHLCLSCYRMLNLNTEQYVVVLKGGLRFYSHIRCRPLKPTHLRLERGRDGHP